MNDNLDANLNDILEQQERETKWTLIHRKGSLVVRKYVIPITIMLLIIEGVIFVSFFGNIWYSVVCFFFCSLILLLGFLWQNKKEISVWLLAVIPLYAALLGAKAGINTQENEMPVEYEVIEYTYESIEQIIEDPDGGRFEMRQVKARTVMTPTQNSTNPILLHDELPWLSRSSDEELNDALRRYNEILDRFEQDSVHFEINPGFLDEGLMLYGGYDWEKLESMSTKKKMKLWEKLDTKSFYDSYNGEYLYYIGVAYLNRGVTYDRLGQPQKALEDYNRVSKYLEYETSINRALAYLHLNDFETALACLDEQIGKSEDSGYRAPELYYYKGYVLLAMNDLDNAAKCYEMVLERDDDYDEAYNDLGLIAFKKGDTAGAMDFFEKAIHSNIDNIEKYGDAEFYHRRAVPFYHNLAVAYLYLGDTEKASHYESLVDEYGPAYDRSNMPFFR